MLRFALLADGPRDRALLSIIRWVLLQLVPALELPEPGFRARGPGRDIADEMREAIRIHSPGILFVHRDAEGQDPALRRRQIPDIDAPLVRVVPVRMTEAWLLIDEAAIRTAASHPRGRGDLGLPPLHQLERVPDPKAILEQALLVAAEVRGRRRKVMQRDLPELCRRVADLIDNFAPLRRLPAFATFERDCRSALDQLRLL